MSTPQDFLYDPQYLVIPFLILLAARTMTRTPFRIVEKNSLLILFFFSVLWFKLYQNWRYFLPFAGWMALCVAAWVQEQNRNGKLPKFAVAAALFALIPVKDLSVNNEAFGTFALKSRSAPGADPQELYLERALGPSYALCQIANEGLPKGSRILLYRDVRGFYLDHHYAWGDPLNPGVVPFRKISDAAALGESLRSQGFTHIFFNPAIGGYRGDRDYYERADRLMKEFLGRYCRKLTSVGDVGLYEIFPI